MSDVQPVLVGLLTATVRFVIESALPFGLLKRRSTSGAAAALSARELEVMQLLRDGHTTDEAARKLFLSPTTVRVHVSTVLRKLRVNDRESAFKLLRDE